jgi:transmembrane protein
LSRDIGSSIVGDNPDNPSMTPSTIAKLLAYRWFGVLARVLLTLPYWTSGIAKLIDIGGALAEVQRFGLRPALLVLSLSILIEIGGSIAVIIGRWTWLAAGAQGVFTGLAALVAYPFWTISDPVLRFGSRNALLEHFGLIGGLMLAAILAERERWQ